MHHGVVTASTSHQFGTNFQNYTKMTSTLPKSTAPATVARSSVKNTKSEGTPRYFISHLMKKKMDSTTNIKDSAL